jgi:hypothetical protein
MAVARASDMGAALATFDMGGPEMMSGSRFQETVFPS